MGFWAEVLCLSRHAAYLATVRQHLRARMYAAGL